MPGRDEFFGIEGLCLFAVTVFAIPKAEDNLAVFDGKDTVIGQGHPMGIASQVIEDFFWRGERSFGIDHPLLFAQGLKPIPPGFITW